jgi:DNA-binding CsgD family transcriptional regulator
LQVAGCFSGAKRYRCRPVAYKDSAMREWSEAELRKRLSTRQYEVLSLVARHLSSKEIGAQLGLSYKTIDNHAADLMARLGVSSRADAARIFLDASGTREQLPSVPQRVDTPAPGEADRVRPDGETAGETLPAGASSLRTMSSSVLKLRPVGGPRHDLTLVQRLAMMGQVALVSVVGLAAIVTVMVGILDLLRR